MPRTFIAIEANEEVQNSLKSVQGELEQTGGDLNLVSPGNVHLTLRFLGDVSESRVDIIKDVINEVPKPDPFQMEVKGLGVFPEPSYIRVVWAGVSAGSEKVVSLREGLDRKLSEVDYPSDDKDFTPHFTIARVKSGRAKDKIYSVVEERSEKVWGSIDVTEIELKKSELTPEGPIYTTLEKAKLG